MDYLPIFLTLKNQACLVVGGGAIAAAKIDLLKRCGALITVVAPEISTAITQKSYAAELKLLNKHFAETDLIGMRLVIAATNQPTVNLAVATAAQQLQILINVVDNPELCSFIFPAIIDRSPIVAAVSTGGASPVLARLLRGKIEAVIPSGFAPLAKLAAKYRKPVKQQLQDANSRRRFWEQLFQSDIAELALAGKLQTAEQLLNKQLAASVDKPATGMVSLVGAGPGDPDLLTLRALRLLQQADVVVYDRLVSADILDLCRRDAEKIYVGKQSGHHSMPQSDINQLLVDFALTGKQVVRLKGGDPFIFGRGGEEIETLAQRGIHFQVVPGITAASGCASYAGIPLTHRDHAQSCLFVTGHLKDGTVELNWSQLAMPQQTVVIYMGLVGLAHICQQLIAHGCCPEHPAAIIQQGTTQLQKVVTGNLENLPALANAANLKAPTLIIIGSVIELHQNLAWFEPTGIND